MRTLHVLMRLFFEFGMPGVIGFGVSSWTPPGETLVTMAYAMAGAMVWTVIYHGLGDLRFWE